MTYGRQLRVLADTNVWLDTFLPDRSGKEIANKLLVRCSADDVALMYPSRAVQDVFFQVSTHLKQWVRQQESDLTKQWAHVVNDQAWECVRTMRELATVAGMDESDLWLACKYRNLHPDLEDNLVLAAAERVQADYLVTSDQQLIAKATVSALTPKDMLAVLAVRA